MEGREHWNIQYTRPQSFIFILTSLIGLKFWVILLNLNFMVSIILISSEGNFVYHNLSVLQFIVDYSSQCLISINLYLIVAGIPRGIQTGIIRIKQQSKPIHTK